LDYEDENFTYEKRKEIEHTLKYSQESLTRFKANTAELFGLFAFIRSKIVSKKN